MTSRTARYLRALDYDWLTPFYDRLIRLTMPEERFRRLLLAQAALRPGHAVLDLGCGTGTLAIMAKESALGARVVGLDGDPAILAIARHKAEVAGDEIEFREGMAYALPFEDATFDRVVSSLVLHHLAHEEKRRALAECHRVLRPGGELHVADWGRPQDALMWLASRALRLFDGTSTIDNLEGRLPSLIGDAGFADVRERDRLRTVFGTLAFFSAQKRSAGSDAS